MTDDPQQPVDARPVGVPILARPAVLLPPAWGAPPPLAYAAAPPPRCYPESGLSRSQAAVDLALIFACIVVSDIGAMLIGPWAADAFPELGILWTNTLMGLVTITAIVGVVRVRRLPIASVGLAVPFRSRAIVGTLVAVPACYMLVIPAVGLYLFVAGVDMTEMAQERQEFFDMIPETSLASLLMLAVFTGIHEELLFRGFILTRIWALVRSKVAAVAIIAVGFGLLHFYQGPIGVIQTTAIGVVLGTIVTLTRSLWPAIIAHVTINAIGLAFIPLISDHMEEFLNPLTTTQAAGL